MKLKLFCLVILFSVKLINAQNYEWVKTIGGLGYDTGEDIILDSNGNIYTIGRYSETADFDSGSGVYNMTSNGITDIFVKKTDGSGNLIWSKSIGGLDEDIAYNIVLDNSNNIYISGIFYGTVDFDPGTGISNYTAVAFSDSFILKLDNNGNFLWVKTFGSTGYDYAFSIDLDNLGNIYCVGQFQYTVDFDPSAAIYNLTSNGSSDIFILKIDASGNFLWAKKIGNNTNWEQAYSIYIDNNNNIYSTGVFLGTVDFNPGSGVFNLVSVGDRDVFVQKLDSSGNFLWAKSFGGALDDFSQSIKGDNLGNIFTVGYFQETIDFDPNAGITNLSSNGSFDAFIHKMDSNGNFLWARTYGSNFFDGAANLFLDNLGNSYLTGGFNGTIDFDNGIGTAELSSLGNNDIFILKLDSDGNFVLAKSFGNTGFDNGISVYTDNSENIYITGNFSLDVNFNPVIGNEIRNSVGDADIFILKLNQNSLSIDNLNDNNNSYIIYPNPTSGLVKIKVNDNENDIFITLSDITGKTIFSKHFDIFNSTELNIDGDNGIYFLNIKTPNSQSTIKLIKQ